MKLHLPKRLLTALLAAFTAISLSTGSTAWGGWDKSHGDYVANGGIYYVAKDGDESGELTLREESVSAADKGTEYFIQPGNATSISTIGTFTAKNGDSIHITTNAWHTEYVFAPLTIEHLNILPAADTQESCSIQLDVESSQTVILEQVSGNINSITNAGNLTLGSNGGSVTLGGNITNTGTLTLRGNVYGTSTITGGTVNLVDFSAAGNLSFGAVQVSGVLGMSSSGNVAWDSLELAEGAILEYGKGANTLNIGTIDKNVTLYLYEVEEKLRSENGVNLGISLGEGQTLETLKSYLSIDGLTSGASFDLIERDGSVYLTSTGTLDSGWDYHWGASVLRDRPTSSVQIGDPSGLSNSTNGNETYFMIQNNFKDVKLVSVELTGSGDYSNAVIVGGFATTWNANSQGSVERDVWIKATAGQYKAIVGGNVADNWGGGNPAHFTGDTHILVNGASVGAIIGGTYKEGKAPKFTGNTYISVLSGDVKDCIFGAAANTHNTTTTFNGNTNIFVYVPLESIAPGSTIGNNGAINAIVGGAGKVANNANDAKSYINGNTNVTIDLSGYTGEATTFVKQIVGGSKNIANSYYAEINGNTYVNIVGKEGISFTKEVIGGSAFGTAGTATINGTTNVQISGGTFSNHIAGGNYSTAGSTNRVTRSSVIINDGSFSVENGQKMVIAGGDFTTAASTNTINTSSVTINKGTFSNYSIVGGTYTTASSTNTVGSSSVTINGGTFSTDSTGGTGDTPYNHLIVGGSMLNGNVANTSFTTTNTSVTITGGDIGMDIYGGHVDLISPSSSNAFTATLDNAIVTLNGANAKVNNIYGGSFAYRDNNNAVMTQGDVVVDLIAGTVRGKVYAAGRQVHNTDIVTKSTEVRISDGVQFTSASAIVSGGYQIGCTGHTRDNPSSVTGNKTLVFNGGSQDRSAITFDSFDTIQVTNKDAVVTLDKLTNFTKNLTKTGAGTLTLGSNSTYTGNTNVQGGELILTSSPGSGSISISQDAKLTLQSADFSLAQTVSGEGELVVKNGVTLTLGSSSKLGTHLRIEDGGRVEFSGTGSDQFNYGDAFFRTVYLKGTAELTLGTTRQTVGNWTFDMTGGVISGQGQTDHPYALDFHRSATILARADEGATAENPTVSTVSATIRTKERGEFKLDVENNARLDLTGAVNLGLKTIKDGAGLAVISGPIESLGGVEVQEGTLELQSSASSTSNLTVNTGAEFEISAGVSTLSGTVTNSGAITVSGGTAVFTNTLGMGIGSGLNVSGGSATVSSALNVTGSGVQIGQSGDGILNLTGQMSIAENASATLSGAITLGHTITNDGNLTLNGTLHLTGDINTSFTTRGLGGSSFVLYDGTASDNGNGFNKVSGASYWLTQSTEGVTGATNTLGGNFAQVDSKHVVYHGDKSYEVITENGQIYFSSGDMTGTQYYITADDVVVNSEVQSAATGYTLQGGNMQLTEGSVNTSDITYTSGFIALSAGAELVVDGMPAGMTANSLLSSILTSSSGGNVKITQSGLDTWDGEGTEARDYNLDSAFAGTLELAADVGFTLGKGGDGQYSDTATITLALTGLKLNNGSTLYYNASGATTIQNLRVAGAAATIHFKDSKSTNAVQFTGKTQLDGALTVSTTFDGGITFANLVGSGSLSSSSGQGDFKTSISSLQYEGSTFSGSLSFTGGNNIVQVSTGTESDLSFASLNASGVKSFTFNAQANTTIGTLNAAGGIVNVSEDKTLNLGGGTAEAQKQHSIGKLSAASAGVTLGNYATLTLGGGTADEPTTHSINSLTSYSGSSISISENAELVLSSLSGVSGKLEGDGTLNLALGSTVEGIPTSVFAGRINTVKLTNGTCMEITGYGQMSAFNYIANLVVEAGSTFSNRLTAQTIGTVNHTLTLAGAGGISGKPDAALAFGHDTGNQADMTMAHSVLLADDATVWVNPSRVGILSGTVNGNGHVLTKTGAGELRLNGAVTKADLVVSEGTLTINGTATGSENVVVNGGTLKLGATTSSMQVGDTATITKAEGGNAATMENVKLSEEGIASADETKATKGSVTDAKVTLAALAEGTSFSIEDVTLSNVNIAAANAGDRVNLSGLSASDVQLTKGEFHMLDKAQPQPQVGTGGSAINPVEGVPTGLQFSTSLLNGMTLGADASVVVDLGDLSGFTGMDSGKPTFSITLEGFRLSDYTGTGENKGLYFAADSWLGQLLVAQGASDYVKGDTLEAGAQATAGTGSGVSVSYNPTSVGVGTVITITGLQVPEPASATLGLAALMMLCARRRRRA